MNCLALKKNAEIESFKSKFNDMNVEVECYSTSWNFDRKVVTTAFGVVSSLSILLGGALAHSTQSNAIASSSIMMGIGACALALDVGAVIKFVKGHAQFVNTVGHYLAQKNPIVEDFSKIEVGKAQLKVDTECDDTVFHSSIIYRESEQACTLQFFQSESLYYSALVSFTEHDMLP